jgi:hypothetical protein
VHIAIGMAGVLAGAVISAFFILAVIRADSTRRRTKKASAKKVKRKMEFVKIILLLVLSTYFIGVFVGAKIVFIDFSQLGVWLAFIGTPTAAAIAFYCWKAKAENIIKIKKDNPAETEGIPVDLNNIHNS